MQKSVLIGAVAVIGLSSLASANSRIAASGQDAASAAARMIGNVGASEASVLYSNVPTGAETVFTTTAAPRTSGGDEAYFAAPQGALITSMSFGYSVATGGPAAFDVRVQAYDQFGTGTAATDPTFVSKKADFTLNFTGQTAGAFITNPIDLTALPGGGVSVGPSTAGGTYSGYATTFWTFTFVQPGTSTAVASNAVTFLFDGSGVNVGTNEEGLFGLPNDLYGRDGAPGGSGLNGIIENGELRSFGGTAGNLSNFVLELQGNLVPEPTSLATLALGGLVLRRRRA